MPNFLAHRFCIAWDCTGNSYKTRDLPDFCNSYKSYNSYKTGDSARIFCKSVYFGGSDYINGEYNTDMIRRTCADAGMVGKRYPKLLKWLDSLGPGWYIPSYGELLKLNYEFQMDKGEVGMKQFQAAMKRAGGDQIKKYHRLASSSETRLVNSLTMAFAIVKFDKDTYSKVDSPGWYIRRTACARMV